MIFIVYGMAMNNALTSSLDSVCMCVHMFIYGQGWYTCISVMGVGGQRSTLSVFLNSSLPWIFEMGSLMQPGALRLIGQRA